MSENTMPLKLPRCLEDNEVTSLFSSIHSPRDSVLIKCLYYLGLRNSELTNLKACDVDIVNRKLHVINGKGSKDRIIPIPDLFLQELGNYLHGVDDFVFSNKSGSPLSTRHVRRIVKKYAVVSGIKNPHEVHPHTLRHSYATYLQNNDVPLNVIQSLLGHSKIDTTTIYTHLGIDSQKPLVNNAFSNTPQQSPPENRPKMVVIFY